MGPVSGEPLAIAQVTPFAWEVGGEINEYVARVSEELARRVGPAAEPQQTGMA